MIALCNVVLTVFVVAVRPAPVPTTTTAAPVTPDIPSVEAIKFMKRFGYLDPGIPDSDALYSEDAIVEAIKTVQKFGAIPETGKLDNKTIELMNSKRCGVPDVKREAKRRAKRYIVGSQGWKKRKITYFLANWSPKIGEEAVFQELQRAFDSWSGYARLTFEHVRDPSADILIAFGRGPHGDGYPFDGPGNILAHAFFPYEMGQYGGDVHFDDDEQWKIKPQDPENGIDFFTVAVHELGHSLGLSHSPVPGSIMFPYYKGYQPNFQLDYDDILAMYELYISRNLEGDKEIPAGGSNEDEERGEDDDQDHDHDRDDADNNDDYDNNDGNKDVDADDKDVDPGNEDDTSVEVEDEDGSEGRKRNTTSSDSNDGHPTLPPSSPSPTAKPNVTFVGDDETVDDHLRHTTPRPRPTVPAVPDICSGHFDAIALLRSELFVFKEEFAWRLSDRNELQPGYPVKFRHIFWKFPETIRKIDCAYQRETDQNIILFTGNMYWVFDGDNFVESPRSITEYGLPSDLSHVDACMVWGKNGKTFLYSGERYWRYNETTGVMDPGYPHNITRWRGVPSHLDAAMTWTDGLTYFFKGPLFWQFNNKLIKTEDTSPQESSKYWLGCS
ncbi:matrix metalloproteinase-25 [Anabrus simplex]|uniref:matrix metalloproteinase-25 n=1 Tax=Anabrus simplex TaxID=316456 RepID=UPI0035A3D4F9